MKASTRKVRRSQSGSSELIEIIPVFGASLVFLFLIVLNLASIMIGYASTYMCARESCAAAAKAANFQTALGEMTAQSNALVRGSIGKLGRLSPAGGYGGSGVDLYIAATNIYTAKTSISGPNQQLPTVDTSVNVYECRSDAHYLITPVLGLASVPIIGDIPGIGRPLLLTCSAHKALEQPTAFAAESATSTGIGSVALSKDQTLPIAAGETCGWDIYNNQFVLQPGQTIAQQGQAVVYANNPAWVTIPDSKGNPVSLNNGQRVSVVANNLWSYRPTVYCAATGSSSTHWVNSMPVAALAFKVGSGGTNYHSFVNSYNMQLPGQGTLYFRCNDTTYADNSLQQNIKVYVTN